MRSTRGHEDRVKVFMVMSRPKSKVYYCFFKLSGIFLQKDCHTHNYCSFIAPAVVSLAWLKIETPNTPLNVVCGVLTLRYTRVNAVSASQETSKIGGNSRSSNNMSYGPYAYFGELTPHQ